MRLCNFYEKRSGQDIGIARNLNQSLVWQVAVTKKRGESDHSFPPDGSDLDAAAVFHSIYNGHYAIARKINEMDLFSRPVKHSTLLEGDCLELGRNQREIVRLECGQQEIQPRLRRGIAIATFNSCEHGPARFLEDATRKLERGLRYSET